MKRYFVLVSLLMIALPSVAGVRVIEDEANPDSSPAAQAQEVGMAVKSARTWKMQEGKTVSKELDAWAASVGWKLIWSMNKDWAVPANTLFTGDFKTVATSVIRTLSDNGVLIRAQFFEGNKTLLVTGPGTKEQ